MMRSRSMSKNNEDFQVTRCLFLMRKNCFEWRTKSLHNQISFELSSVGRNGTPSSFPGWWIACQHYAISIKDCIPPEVFKAPSAHDPGEPLHSKKIPEILIIKLIEEGFYVRSKTMRLQRHTVVWTPSVGLVVLLCSHVDVYIEGSFDIIAAFNKHQVAHTVSPGFVSSQGLRRGLPSVLL